MSALLRRIAISAYFISSISLALFSHRVSGQQFVEAPTNLTSVQCAASVTGDVVYGRVLVGSTLKAARWSPGESVVTLLNPSDATTDIVNATSGDGSIAIGTVGSGNSRRAFRYVHSPSGGDIEILSYTGDTAVTGSAIYTEATCCSLDGEVVYGVVQFSTKGTCAFRWSEDLGFLPILPPSNGLGVTSVHSCSDDGRFVVGTVYSFNFSRGFMWSMQEGGWKEFIYGWGGNRIMYKAGISGRGVKVFMCGTDIYRWHQGIYDPVPQPPGGVPDMPVDFISVDGDVIAGRGATRAFVWTPDYGTSVIGTLGGDKSYPTGLTARGKFAVGNAETISGSEAFLWSRDDGMRPLKTLASEQLPDDPNLPYWRFAVPIISRDACHLFVNGERSGIPRVAYLNLSWHDGGDVNQLPQVASDVAEGETVTALLGKPAILNFTATDADPQDRIVVSGVGLREGAFTLTPESDSTLPANGRASLRIVPRKIDVGVHDVSLKFTDSYGGETTHSFKIEVPENNAPTATPLTPTVREYQGPGDRIPLTMTVADADGHFLTVRWYVNGNLVETDRSVTSGSNVSFEFGYNVGESEVEVEIDDGFDVTSQSTSVAVRDTTAPSFILVDHVKQGTDPGKDFASRSNVTLPKPRVSDLLDVAPILTHDPLPTRFPLGLTIVKWTCTDANGNVSTADQRVMIKDEEAPKIDPRRSIKTTVDRGKRFATIRLADPKVSDNVPGSITVTSKGISKTSRYPIGVHRITWTAKDTAGNRSTRTITVTVVNRAPTANAGGNIVVNTSSPRGARVGLDGSRSSDPDGHQLKFTWTAKGVRLTNGKTAKPSGLFPVGKTMVDQKVRDGAGGVAKKRIQVIVRLKNGKVRPRGAEANAAFVETATYAHDAVVSYGGASAHQAYAYSTAASNIGVVAGDVVLWDDADSRDDATLEYAALRNVQRSYGAHAASAAVAAYVDSGDPAAFRTYASAANGLSNAAADLIEN